MKQFDINQFKHDSAPYKTQPEYVDDLVTRAAERALDGETPRHTSRTRPALIAAAAVAAIAVITLAVAFFNTGDNASVGEQVAIASSTPERTVARETVNDVSPGEEQRRQPAALSTTPPARTVEVTTTDDYDDYDDLDRFLSTLDDDELIAIDDTYIDEIPEY